MAGCMCGQYAIWGLSSLLIWKRNGQLGNSNKRPTNVVTSSLSHLWRWHRFAAVKPNMGYLFQTQPSHQNTMLEVYVSANHWHMDLGTFFSRVCADKNWYFDWKSGHLKPCFWRPIQVFQANPSFPNQVVFVPEHKIIRTLYENRKFNWKNWKVSTYPWCFWSFWWMG